MRKLLLAFGLLLWSASAQAQTNCLVPASFPATSVQTTTGAGSLVLKSSAGCLISVYATIGATGGYLMVFNAAFLPSNGTVTPIECIQVPANTTNYLNWAPQPPEYFSSGIVAAFSTTGCFTLTVGSSIFLHGIVQ